MCTAYFDKRARNESEATSINDNRTLKLLESSVTREDGHIRSDGIRMHTSQLVRPITKLSLLETQIDRPATCTLNN